jgi:CPA2 family monovalent cation:H+ antiporter-2
MEFQIFKDIVIIFALSTLVNFIFNRFKVPTIIGYLLTGIIAGPYLLGIIKETESINVMAELGIILLMFSIGLEFSLNHLFRIRKVVFIGGFIQLIFTTVVTMVVARFYQMDWVPALLVGFLTSLSSTAVVLKVLQDRSEITSNYGRTVVGILIFQDIILIPLLLLTPILGGHEVNVGADLIWLGVKTVIIVGVVYVGNRWFMPFFLHIIALTKNQELFMMVILLICLAVALFTSKLGMSLAFGAFLAGLMISESEYSHNAFGNLIPFKDTFSSFFFVSIGMLLNLQFVYQNYSLVIFTVVLVIFIKATIAGGTAFIMGHTFRGTVMAGIALSQVGEFSFILAKEVNNYSLISDFYYQLFLAVAVITMSVSPLLIQGSKPLANLLLKLPLPKKLVDGLFPLQQLDIPELSKHIVIIGKDSRALNLSKMAKRMKLPYISIVFDPALVRKLQLRGETVLYGDAVNEPILTKAHVDKAEVIVLSIGNMIVSMRVLQKIRKLNQHAHVIVRAKKVTDIEDLYKHGATQVIPEEFETAIDLFERVLTKLLIPQSEINKTIAKLRNDNYGVFRDKSVKKTFSLLKEIPDLETIAYKVQEKSMLVGKQRSEIKFREQYGVTIVAIKRGNVIIDHPGSDTKFKIGDVVYILGRPENIARSTELFVPEPIKPIAVDLNNNI